MEAEVKALCAKAREILVEESNVQRVDSPVTVNIMPAYCFILSIFIDFCIGTTEQAIRICFGIVFFFYLEQQPSSI